MLIVGALRMQHTRWDGCLFNGKDVYATWQTNNSEWRYLKMTTDAQEDCGHILCLTKLTNLFLPFPRMRSHARILQGMMSYWCNLKQTTGANGWLKNRFSSHHLSTLEFRSEWRLMKNSSVHSLPRLYMKPNQQTFQEAYVQSQSINQTASQRSTTI